MQSDDMNGVRIIVLHGSFGAPEANWFPWLSSDLRGHGLHVVTPALPYGDEQSLDSWLRRFKITVGDLMPDDILVGHSMGVGFIVRLLEQNSVAVRGCVFASGFMSRIDIPEFDTVNATFVDGQVNWRRVAERAGSVVMLHGSTDPYVPVALAQDVATALGIELEVIGDGGHLNAEAGFVEFTRVRNAVLDLVASRRE